MNEIHHLQTPGQLHFDDGPFPLVVSNHAGLQSLAECQQWLQTNKSALETQLTTAGALLFRGFPIVDAESFDRFSAAFGYDNFTYQESLSNAVRINYTPRVFTANEAPKDVEIYLHHEMAQTPIFPSKLFFFCQHAADQGGATPLCRSDKLFAALVQQAPQLAQKFIDAGVKYTTLMPGEDDAQSGQGRSWRSTLSVATEQEAQVKLKDLGYAWQWQSDGSLRATTPVLDAVKALPNGSQAFFNQLIAAFKGWKGVEQNPSSALSFGDDSAIAAEDLALIADLAQQFTFDVPWQAGDVALVDNFMCMHGRRPYSGASKRVVLVALAA